MIEVIPSLFVGGGSDLEIVPPEWSVLTCAKEPWHRQALNYEGRGAPKDHPEYLWARRGHQLILNMVDAPRAEFFDERMINEGLFFIDEALWQGKVILVHCNQGNSRAPSIALLYMGTRGPWRGRPFEGAAETEFKSIYPTYEPGRGIREYVRRAWRPRPGGEGEGESEVKVNRSRP